MVTLVGELLFGNRKKAQDLTEDQILESANVYKYSVLDIEGEEVKLSKYKGKVLLIVNVASKCGFTPQYEGLENIYQQYKNDGFEILAFPCNNFASQEPGTNEEIINFCSINYNVTFQLFDKIMVKGGDKEPLYKMLTDNPIAGKSGVLWNFEKFLIDRNGNIVKRYRSKTKPESEKIKSSIEELLKS